MTIKLHGHPMSTHAARVQILMEELSLPYEYLANNLEGENQTAHFLTLNPNAKVPVLEDGDFVLWESHAIMRYLCEKTANTDWYPTALQSRAKVNQWLDWGLSRINAEAITINFNTFVLGEQGEHQAVARSKEAVVDLLTLLDAHLTHSEYLCGRLTLADLSIFCSALYLEFNQLDLAAHKHFYAWYQRLKQRPAVAKVLATMMEE